MFLINLKIALRNLRKYKLFSMINVLGLAAGLTLYLFANLLIQYQNSFDAFFSNSDRVYTIGSIPGPKLELPLEKINATYSKVGSLLKAASPDIERLARILPENLVVNVEDNNTYQQVFFSDPEILEIFDFTYIHGNKSALHDPSALLITASKAVELFGSTNVLGEIVSLENRLDLRVTAVIEDIPRNSHFSIWEMGLFAPMAALGTLRDFDLLGNWGRLLTTDLTYVLLPEHLDQNWLDTQLNAVFEETVHENVHGWISGLVSFPLSYAGEPIIPGLPLRIIIPALGMLILAVACLNYINLATAQSLSRSREIGMRKTLGGSKKQLLSQFLLDSLLVAGLALCISLAALELLIPSFNQLTNSALAINYMQILPLLIGTTLFTGLLAGIYPAWMISRANTLDALKDVTRKGKTAIAFRSVMISVQFAISTFLLAAVVILHFQNKNVEDASHIFPRSEMYVIEGLRSEGEPVNFELLRQEIESLPSVKNITFSSQTPFMQNHPARTLLTERGVEASRIKIYTMGFYPDFLETYDIPLLAGRNLDRNIASDRIRPGESEILNILISENTLPILGLSTAEEALNYRLYAEENDDGSVKENIVVGVVADRNFLSFMAADSPWMYRVPRDRSLHFASVKYRQGTEAEMLQGVNAAWDTVAPNGALQGRFLDETFNQQFAVFQVINAVLAAMALLALGLAMIGLFGLSAFLTLQRTKEIGIRKVLGANAKQLTGLLVWQFSKPVAWALTAALPLAFIATRKYTQFFADPVDHPILLLLAAGLISIMLGAITVFGQAYRAARAQPVKTLRQE